MEHGTEREKTLLFSIGTKNYILPVADVVSVVSLGRSSICRVPFDTSGRILGIFCYRGAVTAILHDKKMLAEAYINGEEKLTAVIVRKEQMQLAVIVDRVDASQNIKGKSSATMISVRGLYDGEIDHDDK